MKTWNSSSPSGKGILWRFTSPVSVCTLQSSLMPTKVSQIRPFASGWICRAPLMAVSCVIANLTPGGGAYTRHSWVFVLKRAIE